MLRAINKFFHQTIFTRIRSSRIRVFPIAFFAVVLFAIPLIYGKNPSLAFASAFSVGEFIDKAIDKVFLFIPNVIHGISSTLVVLAAKLFSWSIEYSTSGETYNNLKFINTTWVTVRDLINSLFIFIVLYIAFRAALVKPGEDVSSAIDRKTLTNLVLAALLINFSLFFVKVAVDTSNVISRGLYYRIQTTTTDSATPVYGPVNAIVAGLKLQTETKNSSNTASDLPAQLVAVLGAIIVDLVTFAVFISISFMFIARIVVLIGVMIASPILFVGLVLPKGKDQGIVKKIQGELYNQAVWPPIFLLVCFVVVQIIQAMNAAAGASNGKGFADAFSGDSGAFSIILNYLIIIGALVGGAKKARDMGKSGYGGMVNKYAAAWGGGAIAGAGAVAYRNAAGAGRWASSVGGEKSIGKRLERGAETSRLARTTLRLGGSLSKGTGDIRNAGKLIEKAPLGVGKLAGVTLGATGISAAEYGKASTKTFASHGYGVKGRSEADIEKKAKELMDLGPAAMVDMMERGTFLNDANKSAILSDKGEKARAAIIANIKDKLKDDPVKQKKLLEQLFTDSNGKNLLSENGADGKEGAIKKQLGKEFKEISKKADSVDALKVIQEEAKETKKFEARYEELEAKLKSSTITGEEREEKNHLEVGGKIPLSKAKERYAKLAVAVLVPGSPDEALRDALKTRIETAKSNLDKISTDDFVKLSTEQMKGISSEISKKQIEALSKVLEAGEKFQGEQDKKNLEELARSIRLNSPDGEAAKILTNMAIKGTGGFGEMNTKLIDVIKADATKDALRNALRSMHKEEFSEVLFDSDKQAILFDKLKPDNGGAEFLAQLPKASLAGALKEQKETHFDTGVDKYFKKIYETVGKKLDERNPDSMFAEHAREISAYRSAMGDGTQRFIEAKKKLDKNYGQLERQYRSLSEQLKKEYGKKENPNPQQ